MAEKYEFKMVEGDTAQALEAGVNLMLKDGWMLHGSTMMATYLGTVPTCVFVQALVRDAGWSGSQDES